MGRLDEKLLMMKLRNRGYRKRQFKDRNIKEARLGREENEKNKKDRKTCGKREGRGDRKLKYNALYCPHFFVVAFLELATNRIKVVCIQTDEFMYMFKIRMFFVKSEDLLASWLPHLVCLICKWQRL